MIHVVHKGVFLSIFRIVIQSRPASPFLENLHSTSQELDNTRNLKTILYCSAFTCQQISIRSDALKQLPDLDLSSRRVLPPYMRHQPNDSQLPSGTDMQARQEPCPELENCSGPLSSCLQFLIHGGMTIGTDVPITGHCQLQSTALW